MVSFTRCTGLASPLANAEQTAIAANSCEEQSIATPSYNISITRPVQNTSVGSWNMALIALFTIGNIGARSTFVAKTIPVITKTNIFF